MENKAKVENLKRILTEIQDINQKPISTKHTGTQNYNDESKETLIKWLVQHQKNNHKIKTEYHEISRQQTNLKAKLIQEQTKNQDLEKEINEYDKTIGLIKKTPETNDNIEDTSILPPIHKLSEYQIWINEQDNIVYRKKVLQKIKNNDNNNNNKTMEFNDCCICYEENNSFKIKTNCKHDICMSCILNMNKTECPMCREPFPEEITNALNKESGEKPVGAYLSQPRGIDNWFSWSGTPKSTGFFVIN